MPQQCTGAMKIIQQELVEEKLSEEKTFFLNIKAVRKVGQKKNKQTEKHLETHT